MIGRALKYSAIVLAIIAVNTFSAAAQCRSIVLPDGTVLTCATKNGVWTYVDAAGNVYPTSLFAPGSGTFEITNTQTNPCQARLKPRSGSTSVVHPALGIITTTFDESRQSTESTIISNQDDAEFPATENIYFYAEVTISSQPGKKYRSIQEVHFSSNNVTSFNPHVDEVFNLVNPVDFEDVNEPGAVAFTLQSGSVTL